MECWNGVSKWAGEVRYIIWNELMNALYTVKDCVDIWGWDRLVQHSGRLVYLLLGMKK